VKRRKIRDVRADTRVIIGQSVNLLVGKMSILTPADTDTVRYYGRKGTDKIFDQLIIDDENERFYNISLSGAPGSGKSNLVWAAAEHLASKSNKKVMWLSRRIFNEQWTVRLFEPSTTEGKAGVYELTNCPAEIKDILKLEIAESVDILILDAYTNAQDSASSGDGVAAFNWTGHEGRENNRRVIHVSSFGSYAVKQTQRDATSLRDIRMPTWTRQDFVDALADENLKRQVCDTLDSIPANIQPEDLVDRKFYYSGINARWFFNHTIESIEDQCKDILDRLSTTTTSFGDKSNQAVNSAVVSFWNVDRPQPTKLYTSNYLAWLLGSNESVQHQFFQLFPLMKDRLGNGTPGEVFECDFAMHLQHSHDLADMQRAFMQDAAPNVDVVLGNINGEMIRWPTGELNALPKAPSDAVSHQMVGLKFSELKDRSRAFPQWFIPKDRNQAFLDFFVLVPQVVDNVLNGWKFQAVQNTVSPRHSTDVRQLKRLLHGVLDAGFILVGDVDMAYVIEKATTQYNIASTIDGTTVEIITTDRTRQDPSTTWKFKIRVLRPVFARSATTIS
jgi:hypothetical protein